MGELSVVILAVIGIMGLGLSKLLYRSWIAPLGIYSLLWSLIPALYVKSILPWPEQLSTSTFMAILGSWLSFTTACITVSLFPSMRPSTWRTHLRESFLRRAIVWFACIGLIGSVVALLKMIVTFGLKDIITNPATVQRLFFFAGEAPSLFIEGVVLHAFTTTAAAIGGIYWGYFGSRKFLWMPIVSTLIYSLARIARLHILIVVVLYIAGYIGGKRLRKEPIKVARGPLPLLIIGLVAIGGITFFVGKTGNYWELKYGIRPSLLAEIFHRINSPIEGLNWAISQHPDSPLTMGRYLLFPFAKVIYRLGGINLSSDPFFIRINPLFPEWGKGFRSVSYLGIVYWDFGWLGVLIAPYLLGLVSSMAYRTRSLFSAVVFTFAYTQIIQSWSWWHFRLPFFTLAFILSAIIALFHGEKREKCAY